MIKFFSCMFLAVSFIFSVASIFEKAELIIGESLKGGSLFLLLNAYLPAQHKIALIVQGILLVLVPVTIIALTLSCLSITGTELLKVSVLAVVATVALLLIDNSYYSKIIKAVLFCTEKAQAENKRD